MKVLGIHDGKDAGVCLLADGKVLFAANEERFSRKKLHFGFPTLSLKSLFETTDVSANDIDRVSVGFRSMVETADYPIYSDIDNTKIYQKVFARSARVLGPMTGSKPFVRLTQAALRTLSKNKPGLEQALKEHGINAPVEYVDHHRSHAASAYYMSGFDDALVVTADGGGDGLAGSIYTGKQGEIAMVNEWPRVHSAGNFWFLITNLCGFDPIRHGGKITGLAAYERCDDTHRILAEFYGHDKNRMRFQNKKFILFSDAYHQLATALKGYSIQQISWGAQKVLEDAMCGVIRDAVAKTGLRKVAMAGGTFANVRLNQKILELDCVDDIFIHPHMGDGGVTVGSALDVTATHQGLKPYAISNVYWGNSATDEMIVDSLQGFPVTYEKVSDPAEHIAECLAGKKVVGLFNGRMEYGPRSLGQRSIIAEPTDESMMNWLNERLDRTEFMPFAPICIEEDAPEYFANFDAGRLASRFMTVCFDVTEHGKKMAPGIVHKDGTARPQIVNATENKYVYDALQAYKRKTGLSLGINTSFNKHEEPIVCQPNDAVEELVRGGIDILFIENYKVTSNASDKA